MKEERFKAVLANGVRVTTRNTNALAAFLVQLHNKTQRPTVYIGGRMLPVPPGPWKRGKRKSPRKSETPLP